VLGWDIPETPLPSYPVVRGGPSAPAAPVAPAGTVLDEAGLAVTDEAGGTLT